MSIPVDTIQSEEPQAIDLEQIAIAFNDYVENEEWEARQNGQED